MLAFAFATLLTLAPLQQGPGPVPACQKLEGEGDVYRGTGIIQLRTIRRHNPSVRCKGEIRPRRAGRHVGDLFDFGPVVASRVVLVVFPGRAMGVV